MRCNTYIHVRYNNAYGGSDMFIFSIFFFVSRYQILPIHAACINPNGQYLSELLSSLPEYAVADAEGFKPVHYAAACDGPGPLKVLLERYCYTHTSYRSFAEKLPNSWKHYRTTVTDNIFRIGEEWNLLDVYRVLVSVKRIGSCFVQSGGAA